MACSAPPPTQPTPSSAPTSPSPVTSPLAVQAAPPLILAGQTPSPMPSASPFASPQVVPIVLKRPGLIAVERAGRILTVDPANPDAVSTLVEGPDNAAPRWSPDGRTLVFTQGRGTA